MQVRLKPIHGAYTDLTLCEGEFLLGRDAECDYNVEHVTVSRRHCKLTVAEHEVHVCDLESLNGTRINNRRIAACTPLRDGEFLAIGDVIWDVSISEHTIQSGLSVLDDEDEASSEVDSADLSGLAVPFEAAHAALDSGIIPTEFIKA
ncbi:MAG: hypothetical protein B7Z55_13810 [Planctomycetales bacterium 12-60-4]|nr:MAG: hypothetical protein B7Z55_13810 [Planctomycetales bacterium 12-60-4]